MANIERIQLDHDSVDCLIMRFLITRSHCIIAHLLLFVSEYIYMSIYSCELYYIISIYLYIYFESCSLVPPPFSPFHSHPMITFHPFLRYLFWVANKCESYSHWMNIYYIMCVIRYIYGHKKWTKLNSIENKLSKVCFVFFRYVSKKTS